MNRSIETMMAEHRLIVRVLAALDTLAGQLEGNVEIPRSEVARFASFFRQFADQWHHGKEEDQLFVKLNACGFPREYGPVGVMLSEHAAGRAHVRAMAEIGERHGPLSREESAQVAAQAREFVPLLLAHINKEDHILYPMAIEAIPPRELAALDVACDAFERATMTGEAMAGLRDLGESLIQAYPADPDQMEAAEACGGCHGHDCGSTY